MPNTVPTYADFIAQYPVLVPPAALEADVQRQLDIAARLLCRKTWGIWYSDGILLFAVHNLSMWLKTQTSPEGGITAAAGVVTSASGAGLSVSFGEVALIEGSKSDAWFNRTAYGQEYLYLKSIVVPSACLSF